MNRQEIINFKRFFSTYVRTFLSQDKESQKNVLLKIIHTFNVCKNIKDLAGDLFSDINNILLAETVALFHDIGRFQQYAQYKTFNDGFSVNHGVLGAEIVSNSKILVGLPIREQDLIINSIRFHNSLFMPEGLDRDTATYLKLIRDADKLDIWRVFAQYYEMPEQERASAAMLGLPDKKDFTKDILSYIYDKKLIPLSNVKTVNDFILMQLSWVFDLNFKKSYQMLLNTKDIEKLIEKLPDTEDVKDATSFIMDYINSRTRE